MVSYILMNVYVLLGFLQEKLGFHSRFLINMYRRVLWEILIFPVPVAELCPELTEF